MAPVHDVTMTAADAEEAATRKRVLSALLNQFHGLIGLAVEMHATGMLDDAAIDSVLKYLRVASDVTRDLLTVNRPDNKENTDV